MKQRIDSKLNPFVKEVEVEIVPGAALKLRYCKLGLMAEYYCK